jgi:hypothetical protein
VVLHGLLEQRTAFAGTRLLCSGGVARNQPIPVDLTCCVTSLRSWDKMMTRDTPSQMKFFAKKFAVTK